MTPRTRFAGRADQYARFRPDYPTAAIDAVLERSGDAGQRLIADVGAGTGISSRMLAMRNTTVIAVEPNLSMIGAAEARERVHYVAAGAEATGIADGSMDLVSCFQAFHWFDPDPALAEFRRILKPGGGLALVWNQRDRDDPFTEAYSQLVHEFAMSHPAEERSGVADPIFSTSYFRDAERLTFPHLQELSSDALVGRARSTSYLPSAGEPFDKMVSRLRELHANWADGRSIVRLAYRTEVYRAHRT